MAADPVDLPPAAPQASAGPITLGRFGRFLVVGGVATLVQYVTAALLMLLADWPPVRASATGYIVGAVANYLLNARFTFGVRGNHGRHLPRFAAVVGIGWVLNTSLMWLFLHWGLHPFVAQPLVTILVLFSNFGLNALWAMRPHGPSQSPS